jgi:hypothetical protein
MRWERLGRVFRAEGQAPWLASHTAMPMAHVKDDRVRLYFGSRDIKNRPHISWIEIDPETPETIMARSDAPVLGPGERGMFDDNGCYPGNLVQVEGCLRLYYMGRSNGEPPLYYMNIGLAESVDGGESFIRTSHAPILGRSDSDPWMTTTPWVMPGPLWVMYYCSGLGWADPPEVKSFYHIKRATSADGLHWQPDPDAVIALYEGESNIAAPTVWKEAGQFHMLYAKVADDVATYRLGYATSPDNRHWIRRDAELSFEGISQGWDSDSQAYPCVFDWKGQHYLIYSGNGLGRDGIGLARRIA